jgi:hypothetical protein
MTAQEAVNRKFRIATDNLGDREQDKAGAGITNTRTQDLGFKDFKQAAIMSKAQYLQDEANRGNAHYTAMVFSDSHHPPMTRDVVLVSGPDFFKVLEAKSRKPLQSFPWSDVKVFFGEQAGQDASNNELFHIQLESYGTLIFQMEHVLGDHGIVENVKRFCDKEHHSSTELRSELHAPTSLIPCRTITDPSSALPALVSTHLLHWLACQATSPDVLSLTVYRFSFQWWTMESTLCPRRAGKRNGCWYGPGLRSKARRRLSCCTLPPASHTRRRTSWSSSSRPEEVVAASSNLPSKRFRSTSAQQNSPSAHTPKWTAGKSTSFRTALRTAPHSGEMQSGIFMQKQSKLRGRGVEVWTLNRGVGWFSCNGR